MNIKTKLLYEYIDSYDNIKSKQNTHFKINIFLSLIFNFYFNFYFI